MTSARTIFGCDLRTLALVRICLGVLIIADLVLRARDFGAHYTDAGVVPREALFVLDAANSASLHMVSGTAWIMAVLFVLAGLVALCLLAGYRSRTAALVSWILLISLDARNQFVSQGGDMLLRVLLFWAMFLPIGARFSVDAALNRRPPESNAHFSVASAALLVQVMCVYFFTALLKSDPVWLPEGTAVYFALANGALVTPVGQWIAQFPALMQALTYFVWCLEIAAPLLVFSPVAHVPVRLFALALLIAMHVGFMLCLAIGLFPLISITSLLTLTPRSVWDWIEQRVRRGAGIRIYYDGECLFCEKTCLLLRTFLLLPEAKLEPAQNEPRMHAVMQAHDSWVVVGEDGEPRVRWQALAWLLRQSPLLAPFGAALSGRWLARAGDRFYGLVAANRARLSRLSRVVLPYSALTTRPAWVSDAACAALLAAVVWINVGTLDLERVAVPSLVRDVGATLRLNQAWTMFAPAPSRTSGWFVAVGELERGGPADVFRGRVGEPTWRRSTYLDLNYETYRWRKFLTRLPLEERVENRPYYLQYLCRQWNAAHAADLALDSIRLYYMAETARGVGLPRATEQHVIWKSDCGADPVEEILDLRRGILPNLES